MKKYRILNQVDHTHTYEEAACLIVQGLPRNRKTNKLKLTIFAEPDGTWSAVAEEAEFSVKVGDVLLQTHSERYRYVMHDHDGISTFDSRGACFVKGEAAIRQNLREGTYQQITVENAARLDALLVKLRQTVLGLEMIPVVNQTLIFKLNYEARGITPPCWSGTAYLRDDASEEPE